jgi:hypothetical protein
MNLTIADCENLINALQEWDKCVGPKELEDDEVGLDAERFDDLMIRLESQLEEQ